MTLRIVLIALSPVHPAFRAARLGSSMWVMFGVILAQTGRFAAPMTQPQTSSRMSGSWPMAAPILRSGRPWGQEKFSSNASTPASWQRSTISTQAILAVLLHDGGDEDALGVRVLAFLELVDPDPERPVADELDVLPADDLLAVGRVELRVAGRDVDDLRRVEADRLGDDGAPSLAEGTVDDAQVRARGPRPDHEGIGQPETVDGCGQGRHRRRIRPGWSPRIRSFPSWN